MEEAAITLQRGQCQKCRNPQSGWRISAGYPTYGHMNCQNSHHQSEKGHQIKGTNFFRLYNTDSVLQNLEI